MTQFQEDFVESHVVETVKSFPQLFVGNVYDAPNKAIWGFEHPDPNQKFHPGACTHYLESSRETILLRGTSQEPKSRYACSYVSVDHQDKSVLKKVTFFELKPAYIRDHKMRQLHGYGLRGKLATEDLHRLQNEINRIFGWGKEEVQ